MKKLTYNLINPIRQILTYIKLGVVIGGMIQAANISAQESASATIESKVESETAQVVPANGPVLVVAEPVFDFGESKDKKIIQHTFVLENIGNEPLVISDVSTSCGCTTAGEFQSEIPAGGKTELPVSFDPTSFGGDIHKLVIVRTNDPEKPETYLRIQGHIWQPVALIPDVMTFKISSSNKQPGPQSMRLMNHLDHPLKPKIKKQSSEAVGLVLKEIEEGKSYELVIQPEGPFDNKTEYVSVTIETGLPDPKEITAQIIVVYQPDVLLLPSRISISDKKTKDGLHTLTVLNRLNTTLELSPIPIEYPGITLDLEEVHAGRLFKVHVKVSEDFNFPDEGESKVFIKLQTNNELQPLLSISIEE